MDRAPQLRILLIDDDEVDRMAVRRGLERSGLPAEIRVARDGYEALTMLRSEDNGSELWPHMVLLDLSMPRMDGFGFLEELRADPELRRAVVMVLSTSDNVDDRTRAYAHSAAAYVVKRDAGQNFQNLVRLLDAYWSVVSLPTN